MIRRLPWTGLGSLATAMALAVALAGCEPRHSFLRPKESDDGSAQKADADTSTSKIPSVDSDSKNFRPFFQNNRLSGGWSSEAREIEKDLGVGN